MKTKYKIVYDGNTDPCNTVFTAELIDDVWNVWRGNGPKMPMNPEELTREVCHIRDNSSNIYYDDFGFLPGVETAYSGTSEIRSNDVLLKIQDSLKSQIDYFRMVLSMHDQDETSITKLDTAEYIQKDINDIIQKHLDGVR